MLILYFNFFFSFLNQQQEQMNGWLIDEPNPLTLV